MKAVIVFLLVLVSFSGLAATTESPGLSAKPGALLPKEGKQKKSSKSTELSFDDVLVQGQYQFSDEAVTTIEQDKVLDALLGVRTNFQDRVQQSADQY